METSASTICQAACAKVLRGAGAPAASSVALPAQFAPHLPGHPEQQDAAGQQQADNGEQLDGNQREQDAQHGGGGDADQDGARAPLGRQTRGGEPDHHGIVARQHQVDHDHLEKGRDRRLRRQVQTVHLPFPPVKPHRPAKKFDIAGSAA